MGYSEEYMVYEFKFLQLFKMIILLQSLQRKWNSFTFMHLADAFIQSDLQCIQVIHFFVSTCSLGIEPTAFVLLTKCSTTEPQEHFNFMKLSENRTKKT